MAPTVDAEQEGPCLDAAGSTVMIRCDDLAADSRWPQFAAAVAAGVRSVLSFQLYTHGPNTGALNLFEDVLRALVGRAEPVVGVTLQIEREIIRAKREVVDTRLG